MQAIDYGYDLAVLGFQVQGLWIAGHVNVSDTIGAASREYQRFFFDCKELVIICMTVRNSCILEDALDFPTTKAPHIAPATRRLLVVSDGRRVVCTQRRSQIRIRARGVSRPERTNATSPTSVPLRRKHVCTPRDAAKGGGAAGAAMRVKCEG